MSSCLYIQVIIIEEKKNYQKEQRKVQEEKKKERDIDTHREREDHRRGALFYARTPCSMLSSSHIQPLFFTFFIPLEQMKRNGRYTNYWLSMLDDDDFIFVHSSSAQLFLLLLLVASLSKIAGYILLLKKEKEERGKRKLEIVCYCSP